MTDRTMTPAGRRHPGTKLRRVQLARGATFTPQPEPLAKPSAMLRSSKIERWQPTFERCIGGVLLGLSIAGTIALFNGKWGQPTPGAFFAGLTVQGLLTFVQWLYRRRRWSWQYLTALGIDVLLSVAGYSSIVVPRLSRLLDRLTGVDYIVPLAPPPATMAVTAAAWFGLLGLAALLAYIPERILVED